MRSASAFSLVVSHGQMHVALVAFLPAKWSFDPSPTHDRKVDMGFMWPTVEEGRECLMYCKLPFSEDIRQVCAPMALLCRHTNLYPSAMPWLRCCASPSFSHPLFRSRAQ